MTEPHADPLLRDIEEWMMGPSEPEYVAGKLLERCAERIEADAIRLAEFQLREEESEAMAKWSGEIIAAKDAEIERYREEESRHIHNRFQEQETNRRLDCFHPEHTAPGKPCPCGRC